MDTVVVLSIFKILIYAYVRGRRDKIKWDLLSEGIEDSIDAVAKANLNLEILSNTVLSVWEKNGTSIGEKMNMF
jgi:hypothetical protein